MEWAVVDPGFSTPAMAAVWAPRSLTASIGAFEVALARACAAAGIVPEDVLPAITEAVAADVDDPADVFVRGWEVGTPVIVWLEQVRARMDDEAAQWLHHGTTSQDALDTAMLMQAREGLAVLRTDLAGLALNLRTQLAGNRERPAVTWTLLQQASTGTWGRRLAGWLAPMVDHLWRLRTRTGKLPLQLGGPTGDLAAWGDRAPQVVEAVARDLHLAVPLLSWHTDRTLVIRLMEDLQVVAGTVAKVAGDLALLAQQGVVRMRAGASSSMPHKANPVDAVRAIAAAEACRGVTGIVGARSAELERAAGGWQAEWFAVPLAFQTCHAAVSGLLRAVQTLEVLEEVDADSHGADVAAVDAAGVADVPGDGGGAASATDAAIDRLLSACDAEVQQVLGDTVGPADAATDSVTDGD